MLPRNGGPDSFSTLGAITEFQLRPGHIRGTLRMSQVLDKYMSYGYFSYVS